MSVIFKGQADPGDYVTAHSLMVAQYSHRLFHVTCVAVKRQLDHMKTYIVVSTMNPDNLQNWQHSYKEANM